MAENFTFPQSGDNDDAEHFSSLIGMENLSDYVETGLDLQNYNSAGPDIDVTTGKCYIGQSSETASSSGDTILQTNSVVQIPATSTLALTDSSVNEIYVDPDFGTDDNGSVNATTGGVPSGSLKIGEVDTTADTVDDDFNREPSISASNILLNNTSISTESHSTDDSGTVIDGDAGIVFSTSIDDAETFTVDQYTFHKADGTAMPSNTSLRIVTLDGVGGGTSQQIVESGDGSTIFTDITTAVTYTNSSGSTQNIAIVIDNGEFGTGSGAQVDAYASANVRVN